MVNVMNLVEVESKLKNILIRDDVKKGTELHSKLLEVLNDLGKEVNSVVNDYFTREIAKSETEREDEHLMDLEQL